MQAGLDFGTSSCSIGVWKSNAPVLVRLDGQDTRLPSALYTYRPNLPIEKLDMPELGQRVAAEKRRLTEEKSKSSVDNISVKELTDSEIENIVRGTMRREIADRDKARQRNQSISGVLNDDSEVVFGEAAIRNYIQDPAGGFFIRSPKSFLGEKISLSNIDLFSEVVTRILRFIKDRAEESVQKEIQNVVLGRPVNFHGTRGKKGNDQALSILHRAAISAGFENVEFLLEPIAAALDFERSMPIDRIALVLDVGGGTTDCSMIKLGPSYIGLTDRDSSVLGCTGTRLGGVDIDIRLALRRIMPYFGKDSLLNDGLPIPSQLFWNAIAVNDIHAQQRFLSDQTKHEIALNLAKATDPGKFTRLQKLHNGRLAVRLNRSAELAKIHLSDRDPISLPLGYIEPGLVIPITRRNLKEAINHELDKFHSLMKEVESQAGVAPDIIYITGGTAKSPVVEEWIRSKYNNIEIVVGDVFGSVASGLTSRAHRLYE